MAERIRKLNVDIKLATKQLAKSSKAYALSDNKNYNDVLENNFYEGILQKSMMNKSGYGIDEVSSFFSGDIDISTRDGYGRSLLSLSIAMNNETKFDECMTKSMGAEVCDSAGNTPIILAAISGNAHMVQKLLDRGINVNARNLNDESALMAACSLGHIDIVKLLLAAGADMFKRDATGNTALCFAAIFGQEECVRTLIDLKCDINGADKFGNTPLHHALKCGKEKVAMLLLKNGASKTVKDKYGQTVIDIAKSKNMNAFLAAAE